MDRNYRNGGKGGLSLFILLRFFFFMNNNNNNNNLYLGENCYETSSAPRSEQFLRAWRFESWEYLSVTFQF